MRTDKLQLNIPLKVLIGEKLYYKVSRSVDYEEVMGYNIKVNTYDDIIVQYEIWWGDDCERVLLQYNSYLNCFESEETGIKFFQKREEAMLAYRKNIESQKSTDLQQVREILRKHKLKYKILTK